MACTSDLSLRGGRKPDVAISCRHSRFRRRLSHVPAGCCEIATAPAEPRNDKSGGLPHPEGRNDKAGSAPLPCHCEEGVSPTWQSQAGTYESAGAFLCSSQSCEIATAPLGPRNDKFGSITRSTRVHTNLQLPMALTARKGHAASVRRQSRQRLRNTSNFSNRWIGEKHPAKAEAAIVRCCPRGFSLPFCRICGMIGGELQRKGTKKP